MSKQCYANNETSQQIHKREFCKLDRNTKLKITNLCNVISVQVIQNCNLRCLCLDNYRRLLRTDRQIDRRTDKKLSFNGSVYSYKYAILKKYVNIKYQSLCVKRLIKSLSKILSTIIVLKGKIYQQRLNPLRLSRRNLDVA